MEKLERAVVLTAGKWTIVGEHKREAFNGSFL